jgi:hypothetical protein
MQLATTVHLRQLKKDGPPTASTASSACGMVGS